jgi:hypothetical protein
MLLSDQEMALINTDKVTISPISNNVENNAQQLKAKAAEKLVKVRSKKIVKLEGGSKSPQFIQNDQTNPLDLSIPFEANEHFDLEKKWLIPHESLDIFAVDTNKKARSLELNGNLLMSPEPQAEKRKSVDGAGISINIKP